MTDAEHTTKPKIILVMGVSGSGKTTIGGMLAGRLGREYAEADDFHPAANLEKMRSGQPLTDEDRWPWLQRIADWIDERLASGTPAVVTCSALKRKYRDVLRRPGVTVVYLEVDPEVLTRRMAARHGHFFPAKLLESQLKDLEPPAPEEHAHYVTASGEPPAEIVQRIVDELHLNAD
ncbi:gluconokinase [Actinomadura scrupuli]|uniref:gluconokinase n=1 Tax=Actinomadura scrupuli TaxID=559629 RepID=UPI003D98D93A